MNEKLLMEVVRMLREREEYSDAKYESAWSHGDFRTASKMLGKAVAYSVAREMLTAALAGNEEILRKYDRFGKEDK